MLVLTQAKDEKVTLTLEDGRQIIIMVTDVKRDRRVRIGYDAPRTIHIVRDSAVKKEPKNV